MVKHCDRSICTSLAVEITSFLEHDMSIAALGHEYKLLSPLGMNAPGLLGNLFWRVGSVACKFYCLEVILK